MIVKISTKALFEICKEQGYVNKNITYQEFYYIVRDFNKAISEEIMEGYKFTTVIGTFEIVKKQRVRRSIDWGSSNKRKEALIKDGKTPFNKINAPQGENWFVYFTESVKYIWQWMKSEPVKGYCYFLSSWDNKKALGKIVKKKKETNTENYVSLI